MRSQVNYFVVSRQCFIITRKWLRRIHKSRVINTLLCGAAVRYELFMSFCHLLLECFPYWSHVRVLSWFTRQQSSFSRDNVKKKAFKKNKPREHGCSRLSLVVRRTPDRLFLMLMWSPLCASLSFHHEAQLHITMHEYILRMRVIDPHGESCTFTCSTRYAGQKSVSDQAAGNPVFCSRMFY